MSQSVQKASTTATLSAVPLTANVNQSVTFTATITPGTSGVPTGTVSFLDGTTEIGATSLNGSGAATFSTSTLTAGTHAITAVYAGDGNFNGSTSSGANVVLTDSGFSLSSSALSPVEPGGSARSTITVASTGGFDASTLNLSCTVAPHVSAAVTCSLGAISVTGGNGSTTLTVSTTGPVATLRKQGGVTKLALALLMPGLFVCGAGMRKSSRRKLLAAALVFPVLTGCMLQTACVGTSSSGKSTATPAGSYTVTVMGSGGGMEQTTSVSLTVQ